MPLIDRKTKLKARRIFRKQKRRAESASIEVDQNVEKLVFRRLERLKKVQHFVFVWTTLIVLLGVGVLWQSNNVNSYYLKNAPAAGGTYREGVIGSFTTSNPLFAISSVDASVSKLLYSGLFKISPRGQVIGDLAKNVEISEDNLTYTVNLKENIMWHDGEKFDAEDVLFTYQAIQKAESRSPLRSSWRGVKVALVDAQTVTFTLPNVLSSFEYSMTNGIVPEHILGSVDPENLRSSSFNTIEPVGTGPFVMKTLEVTGNVYDKNRQERIALTGNDTYFGQKPSLDGVVIQSYRDEIQMLNDFDKQFIQSMVGLTSVSDTLMNEDGVTLQQAALTSAVMVFLNNSSDFFTDVTVRQAVVHGTNAADIRANLGYDTIAVDSPFLRSQFAYNPEITQLPYDVDKAKELLKKAGWKLGSDGTLEKNDKKFIVTFVSQSLSEYATISQKLQQEWGELGIKVEAVLQPEQDIQKSTLVNHEYDVLLYGISVGYDPDVFAYWHSSQADPNTANLNLAEYKNEIADEALESGRTRIDPELRKVKYEPFLKAWQEDAPAIALYQPRFFMVTRGTFTGFETGQMSTATDRYYSIGQWRIRNAQVVK